MAQHKYCYITYGYIGIRWENGLLGAPTDGALTLHHGPTRLWGGVPTKPFWRYADRTSPRTHLEKVRASGLRLRKIRAYRPDSEMMVISCFPPGASIIWTPFSSSSRRARLERGFSSARISQTSFATDHGSPSKVSIC